MHLFRVSEYILQVAMMLPSSLLFYLSSIHCRRGRQTYKAWYILLFNQDDNTSLFGDLLPETVLRYNGGAISTK